jgi:hypothetical protein
MLCKEVIFKPSPEGKKEESGKQYARKRTFQAEY